MNWIIVLILLLQWFFFIWLNFIWLNIATSEKLWIVWHFFHCETLDLHCWTGCKASIEETKTPIGLFLLFFLLLHLVSLILHLWIVRCFSHVFSIRQSCLKKCVVGYKEQTNRIPSSRHLDFDWLCDELGAVSAVLGGAGWAGFAEVKIRYFSIRSLTWWSHIKKDR